MASASEKAKDANVSDKDIAAALKEDGFDAYVSIYDLGMESGKKDQGP